MKKPKITAFIKALNVRMKKEPITLRYIHILGTVVFFTSISSLVILLALYLNQRLQTSLFLQNDHLSSNPLTYPTLSPAPPPHGSDMADEELMRRAAMAPREAVMNETHPKVAFMFLTRWNLPLSPLWEIFFKGHEDFYSIYVHTSPEFTEEPPESSVFYKKRIPSKTVEWGQSSMMDAERRLLSHALLKPSNSRFVLLSETCIPLFNFTTVYTYLMGSTRSFLGSFDDPRPMGRGRYNPKMLPHVSLSDWRKGNQWFELSRTVAAEIISDDRYYNVFKDHCRPPCYIDEHYIPTLVNKICPEMNSNRTVTWVDWSRGGSHPARFVRKDIQVGFLDRIRFGSNCSYEGEVTNLCFLFARKKKSNKSVRHQQQPGELRKQQDRDARLIEENEKMVEELQQQMFYIERKIPEKQLNVKYAKSKASYRLDCGWSQRENFIYRNSEMDRKKMELEKLTFAHGAYRDKKAVLYFSSGKEPELNIHNLNYRMLHEARSVGGERRLLNMANPNKHSNSGSSLKELDQQVTLISSIRPYSLFFPFRFVVMEREQLFSNAPIEGSLWNALPSTMDLRSQIQALETSKEKKIKVISERIKEIDSNKRELRKAENEIKSLRKTMGRIRQKKQKALQTLSHLKESS
ncbi:hypothetical protein Bca52824_062438 [Brassica carinata]|uniref:Core-2/I-branching beta-1,6-N-acetylglucosaminyltransferase family protein n=1 Tax=Brassica carinata TaxID=52824 RepID=A0A8X7QE76_BRACI|nr:hypothetical protein Bca52824_062438 [Brassica carinata]